MRDLGRPARLLRRAAALVAALALLVGCGDGAARWTRRAAEDSAAAERALARGDRDEAVRRLTALVEREVPSGVADADARLVRRDACDRLARIALARGNAERARRWVAEGLSQGEAEDVFTANLLTTRGRLHEAAGRDAQAARDYHRALRIHEALLDEVLGDEEGDEE
jgi:tetratricopeptide (TPR) repeat protein